MTCVRTDARVLTAGHPSHTEVSEDVDRYDDVRLIDNGSEPAVVMPTDPAVDMSMLAHRSTRNLIDSGR